MQALRNRTLRAVRRLAVCVQSGIFATYPSLYPAHQAILRGRAALLYDLQKNGERRHAYRKRGTYTDTANFIANVPSGIPGGYTTVMASDDLWPWPYEDKIKAVFAETNNPPSRL